MMTHTSLPAAHGGDQWQARDRDALATVGVTTEYGRLRRVIMHRPGGEIDGITNPGKVLWDDIVEPTAAREQHDNLTSMYRSFGVEVIDVGIFFIDRCGNGCFVARVSYKGVFLHIFILKKGFLKRWILGI
jgi:hypothetical protein